jgi:hypothetical protein
MAAKRIRAHVKYLSSDALEGRGMGQKGSEAAADYIGKQLESNGLKPAGDDGTYFQKVPMVGVKTLPQTTFEVQRTGGESFVLKNLDDFVTNNESQMEAADLEFDRRIRIGTESQFCEGARPESFVRQASRPSLDRI